MLVALLRRAPERMKISMATCWLTGTHQRGISHYNFIINPDREHLKRPHLGGICDMGNIGYFRKKSKG